MAEYEKYQEIWSSFTISYVLLRFRYQPVFPVLFGILHWRWNDCPAKQAIIGIYIIKRALTWPQDNKANQNRVRIFYDLIDKWYGFRYLQRFKNSVPATLMPSQMLQCTKKYAFKNLIFLLSFVTGEDHRFSWLKDGMTGKRVRSALLALCEGQSTGHLWIPFTNGQQLMH